MSEEQLKAFLEKVKADTSLQEKLKAAADSDAVLAIAKEAGFSVSVGDLKNAQSEVSEEELEEGVAGRTGDPSNGPCIFKHANGGYTKGNPSVNGFYSTLCKKCWI